MDIEAAMRSGLGADERAFTIARLLAVRAAASPDAPAIAAPGMADLSYGALADQLGDVAARLAALGVQPGCRVALVLPEGSACAATLLAVAQFTTCAPLDPALPADVLADTLDRIGPALLLVAAETAADVRAAAAARGIATAEVRPDPA
ncbi:MAG: AMP-binding protein, partial [Chloroflexia bacterium]|nr:AMP-binding protein [Chloroflexia bacterium]